MSQDSTQPDAQLEREVLLALPELEVIDRDLVVRESLAVDWVGVEAGERVCIVMLAERRGREVVLDVIDALTFTKANAEVLARHWDLDEHLLHEPPRAVCIAESFDAEAVERFDALTEIGDVEVRLFEIRTLSSQAGRASYLVPLRADVPTSTGGAFLDNVPDESTELAELFVERMARVDDGLELRERSSALEWTLDGRAVGELRVRAGRLEGLLPGFPSPLSVRDTQEIDEFIDQALARLVELEGGVRPARETPDRNETARPRGIEVGELEAADGDELPELEDIELIPQDPTEPLLTAEEIDAFRDS